MPKNQNPLVKPFVKWAGGKRQLIPEIKKYMPKKTIKHFYEPFVGGGAVFLNMQFSNTIINDFNGQLTNTYIVIRDHLDKLLPLLELHKEKNSSDYYYAIRSWDRNGVLEHKNSIEKAARFIYLNKTGFNGLFRVNSQNQINVPYGRYKNPSIVNEEVLRAVSVYLNKANVKILTGDYADAIKSAKKGDFVYLDPPYAPITEDKDSFVGYTLNGFNHDEQVRLRDEFDKLTEKGINAMLSNSNVKQIKNLYARYAKTTKVVKASRPINSNAIGRGQVEEVLIMNY